MASFRRTKKSKTRKDEDDSASIHEVCQFGSVEDVRALVNQGEFVIKQTDKKGQSPLHIAAYEAKLDVVMLLRERGADVNMRDNQGWTPIHSCCASSNPDGMTVAKYLLATSGTAHVDALSNSGATPLHYLARGSCVSRNRDVHSTTDHCALKNEHHFEDTVKMLVSRGADVNTRTKYGETPLHQAAAHDNVLGVKALHSLGADLDFHNKNGETSLHVAIRMRAKAVAIALLEAGADPLAKSFVRLRMSKSGSLGSKEKDLKRSTSTDALQYTAEESGSTPPQPERGGSCTAPLSTPPAGISEYVVVTQDGSDALEYAYFYGMRTVVEKIQELHPNLSERIQELDALSADEDTRLDSGHPTPRASRGRRGTRRRTKSVESSNADSVVPGDKSETTETSAVTSPWKSRRRPSGPQAAVLGHNRMSMAESQARGGGQCSGAKASEVSAQEEHDGSEADGT